MRKYNVVPLAEAVAGLRKDTTLLLCVQVWFAQTRGDDITPDPVGQRGVNMAIEIAKHAKGKVFILVAGGKALDTGEATLARIYANALAPAAQTKNVSIVPQLEHFAKSMAGEVKFYRWFAGLAMLDRSPYQVVVVAGDSNVTLVQTLLNANMPRDGKVVTYQTGAKAKLYFKLSRILLRVDPHGNLTELLAIVLGGIKQVIARKALS